MCVFRTKILKENGEYLEYGFIGNIKKTKL